MWARGGGGDDGGETSGEEGAELESRTTRDMLLPWDAVNGAKNNEEEIHTMQIRLNVNPL